MVKSSREELDALVRDIKALIENPSENKSRAIYYLSNSDQLAARDYNDRSNYSYYLKDDDSLDESDDEEDVKITRSFESVNHRHSTSYSIEDIERLFSRALQLLIGPSNASDCYLHTNILIIYLGEILIEKCMASEMYERSFELASKYLLNSYKYMTFRIGS